MEPSDAELIRLAIGGDEGAFDALVKRHWAAISAFLRRMVGWAGGDYEQLTVDTFLEIHRNLGKFRPGAELRPWLMTSAKNNALDWLRVQVLAQRRDADDAARLEEHVGTQKLLAHEALSRSKDWLDRYVDERRGARIRQGALLRLLGGEYLHIAEECGYKTADAARLVIRNGIISAALLRPDALEEACEIQRQYKRIAALEGLVCHFLNVVDIEQVRNAREASHG